MRVCLITLQYYLCFIEVSLAIWTGHYLGRSIQSPSTLNFVCATFLSEFT